MTPEDLAEFAYDAVQHASNFSERSLQAASFQAGVSDLGYCSERLRRMIDQQVPEDSDVLAAFIGTALGDHVERAMYAKNPSLIIQSEVTVTLRGEDREYVLTGHPDIIDPVEGILIDVKSKNGLEVPRRNGPSLSQQFQRHLYAVGAHRAGLFPDHDLHEVRVANLWIDRSAVEHEFYCHMEPYDEDYLRQAGEWLDDVVYAYLHEEEARKEPPREVCEKTCGFFATCRALDTDVEGLLTDSEVLTAIQMHTEATEMEKIARRLKAQAKPILQGVSGSTGKHIVRTVLINPTEIAAYTRAGYERIEVRPIK